MGLKMKNRNFVAKNMGVNKGGTHRDKKNDYQRPTGKKDKQEKISGCQTYYDYWNGDYECSYNTTIDCDDCKYGSCGGRKDPAAKCNQL